ncbi:MAG TPA: hypothetical protein VLH75_20515 [Longimicrobiales bacterium]|nr:hypothetical protein [Longimicrobiales bacterium]
MTGWKRNVSPAEAYQRHVADFTKALGTWSAAELGTLKRETEARLRKVQDGKAQRDASLGPNEAAELTRMIDRITERVAYLGRVAAGGVDPGRAAAERGANPLDFRLRESYVELDELEANGGDAREVLQRIAHLKKALDEGGELGPPAVPEEVLERKRAERRYASL